MKARIFFVGGIVLFLIAAASVLKAGPPKEELTSLKDIGYIKVTGYAKDGILKATITYRNSETGALVYWTEGKVNAEFEIYEKTGNVLEQKRGELLASASKQFKAHNEEVEISIPKSDSRKEGIIYCTVNTGYEELSSKSKFWY